MARVWIAYREGHRLLGVPVADAPFAEARARLDLAPWRLYAESAPEPCSSADANSAPRRRVLVEVATGDVNGFSAYAPGRFYESPYSPEECLKRLGRKAA